MRKNIITLCCFLPLLVSCFSNGTKKEWKHRYGLDNLKGEYSISELRAIKDYDTKDTHISDSLQKKMIESGDTQYLHECNHDSITDDSATQK